MSKNGFTLIELMATIVVLAIVALITTPIVLNIINNSKDSSNKRSTELYAKAIENAVADHLLIEPLDDDVDWCDIRNDITKYYDGRNVECNITVINSDGTIFLNECILDNKSYFYGISKIPGDVDGNGILNTNDANLLGNYIDSDDKESFLNSSENFKIENADVNLDKSVNIIDKTLLVALIDNQDEGTCNVEQKNSDIKGDINLDCVVNNLDIDLLRLYLGGKTELSDSEKLNADMDGNDSFNIKDSLLLKRKILYVVNDPNRCNVNG